MEAIERSISIQGSALLWAIPLSLTVHLGLLFCLDHWNGGGRSGFSVQGKTGTPISVQLETMNGRRQEKRVLALATSPGKGEIADKAAPEKGHGDSVSAAPLTGEAQSTSQAILPELHYFRPDELTEKPRLLHDIPSDYLQSFPGVFTRPLKLRLLINERGDVDKVVIEEAQLPRKTIRFLEKAFSKPQFLPGKLGGMPVKSQIVIRVALQNTPAPTSSPILPKP